MKALPCPKCGQAVGPRSGKFPNGEPLMAGKANSWPMIYKCSRCKQTVVLPKDSFNRLPNIPEPELNQHFAKKP